MSHPTHLPVRSPHLIRMCTVVQHICGPLPDILFRSSRILVPLPYSHRRIIYFTTFFPYERTSVLFIYGVFKDTATASDYTASNVGIICTQCIGKYVEGTGRSGISRPLCFLLLTLVTRNLRWISGCQGGDYEKRFALGCDTACTSRYQHTEAMYNSTWHYLAEEVLTTPGTLTRGKAGNVGLTAHLFVTKWIWRRAASLHILNTKARSFTPHTQYASITKNDFTFLTLFSIYEYLCKVR
jgi:hypothetical protein